MTDPAKSLARARVARVAALIKKVNGFMERGVRTATSAPWNPDISNADLQSWGVSVKPLNLEEGARDVWPIPYDQMVAWLKKYRPWYKTERFGDGRNTELDKWWNARLLHADMEDYIEQGELFGGGGGIMPECTRWSRRVDCPFGFKIRNDRLKLWYDLVILEYQNKTVPHVNASIYQNNKLHSGVLTVPELFLLANLTQMRLSEGALQSHYVVPVTIISFGDCNARVIHGYFDGQTSRVNIWMSKTMNFEKPGGYKGRDWTNILRWAIAEPVRAPENVV